MGADYISEAALVDTIGPDAARAMCQKWGGRTKYIPKDHHTGDLAAIVGIRAAEELAARFGGTTLLLPNPKARAKTHIITLLEKGMSEGDVYNELRKIGHKVTTTWIRRVKKDAKIRNAQRQKALPIRCP